MVRRLKAHVLDQLPTKRRQAIVMHVADKDIQKAMLMQQQQQQGRFNQRIEAAINSGTMPTDKVSGDG